MPCKCQAQGCENLCVCGEKYCDQCFLDRCEDDEERNIYVGGRFYGEKLLKEDDVSLSGDTIHEG